MINIIQVSAASHHYSINILVTFVIAFPSDMHHFFSRIDFGYASLKIWPYGNTIKRKPFDLTK